MKLGVLTALFQDQSLEKALDTIAGFGVDAVEIGTGNFVGDAHCNPKELLESDLKLKEFKKTVEDKGLFISALSCHGNPLHPQSSIAKSQLLIFCNENQSIYREERCKG